MCNKQLSNKICLKLKTMTPRHLNLRYKATCRTERDTIVTNTERETSCKHSTRNRYNITI